MTTMEALHAIDKALEAMPDSFTIKPFLMAHKAEVRDMLLTEYNEAEAMELFREDGRAEGRIEGIAEGKAEGRAEGRAEGMAEGRIEATSLHVASLMDKLGLTAEQALDALGVPEEDRGRLLEMMKDKD